MVKLTNDQSSTCGPVTYDLFGNAISSPESEDGRSRSVLPIGPKIAKSGPDHALVSRFRALDSGEAISTNDTSGPLFTNSSPSADLQRSLENRLRARMDVNGSPEFELTWEQQDMPSGPPICRLAVSARRTDASGCSGWPTPQVAQHGLAETPEAKNARGAHIGTTLMDAATLSSWPTPVANDDNKSPEAHLAMKKRMGERDGTFSNRTEITSLQVAAKAAWPTPKASDGEGGRTTKTEGGGNSHLPITAREASPWATPNVDNAKNSGFLHTSRATNKDPFQQLHVQVQQASGPTPSGSPEPMEKRGALNPEFVCWLMGYPPVWDDCAVTAMQSSPKSRRK